MILQELAVEKIELISQNLDALVKKYGFTIKVRESDTTIYKELLRYEKAKTAIDIVVCLHPHDYPYVLNVCFLDKEPYNWKRVSISELLRLSNAAFTIGEDDLPISTKEDLQQTIDKLAVALENILKNELYRVIK